MLQQRSRKRVALILSAARRIISMKGSSGLTMSDLATEAGMTPASVYRYFRDRTAVLRMLGEQTSAVMADRFHESVTSHRQDRSGLSGLFSNVLDDQHTLYRSDPVLRDIWASVLAEPALEDIVRHHAELKLRILTDAILTSTPSKLRTDSKTDVSLCLQLVQTATLAALDQPALQGKAVIDKAKGWLAPLLAAIN